jgi:prevent-host-death family protein
MDRLQMKPGTGSRAPRPRRRSGCRRRAAKTQFSQIVDRASKGEHFVIAKSGRPLAKVAPLDDGKPAGIRFGLMKG